VKAGNRAERSPAKPPQSLTRYAIDPALGTFQGLLAQFQLDNIEWRGTPPVSRPKVTSTRFDAQPYATVTIVDCPTLSSTWRPYNSKTGKPMKLVKPKVAPPWATTATVVLYHGRWMVHATTTDMTRTCKP
jgi:hypothetical protein